MTVFNENNVGFMTKKYPLFLGDDLGLVDTVNITYPQLESLYQLQVSQIWNELEISLEQDKQDMLTQSNDVVDLMVKTISWQMIGDSIASKSITGLLMKYVTNPELESMLNAWAFFESIHARAYSHIVKQTFTNPNLMLEETYKNRVAIERTRPLIEAFDHLENLPSTATREETIEAILLAMVAFYALEGIAFMSSFAVTFAITETGTFQGIGQEVTLIARDELIHTRMGYTILKTLLSDPEFKAVFDKITPSVKTIFDCLVKNEMTWADYLFSEGRQVIGLSAQLLKEYTQFMAYPIYRSIGIKYDFEIIKENPCPYMDSYVDSTKVQVAPQEIQISSYKIGAVKDDSDGLDLDFDL